MTPNGDIGTPGMASAGAPPASALPGAAGARIGVQAWSVLLASTLAFLVCFVVWMMFGVLGVELRQELRLNGTQFGLLTSTPVLTGALLRLPLGIWTDRYGGRIVMTVLLVVCAVPVYIVSYATALWQLLLIGLFLGCVGASFAVGTPYVARFFPPARRGFAMGFFGAGTAGAAVNLFITPSLQAAYGWRFVPRAYAIALLVTAAIFWFASARDPGAGKTQGSMLDSFKVLRDPRVWRLCQYYSITFGGFTALSLWMPQYLQGQYGISLVAAAAFAAGFSLPGSVLRAIGGSLADRFGAHTVTWWGLWVAWICLFLLSYPPTDLAIQTLDGAVSFRIHTPLAVFIVLAFILGAVFAFGMASTFKYVADDFPANMGVVTGIVGLAGGLGGFLLPILFGVMQDIFRIRSACFMLLYGIVWVSLILLYLSQVRRTPITGAGTDMRA
jgi:NNP family nitrate/nitrite transporter-like MFS transporter